MALKRQGLSQRRKAVGFTQESLAEHLGVERSTVVRWEAGETKPLPAMRPRMARALQVSVDQLTELLTEPENAAPAPARSADAEMTIPMLLPEIPSKMLPGQVELEDLIPQVAETVEVLRQALRSAGVVAEDVDAMLLAGRSSPVPLGTAALGHSCTVDADPQGTPGADPQGTPGFAPAAAHPVDAGTAWVDVESDITEPAGAAVARRPSLIAVPLDTEPAAVQPRRTRFTRLAAAGVLLLVFAGGTAAVPFLTSHNHPLPPATGTTSAPAVAAANPAPGSGSVHSENPAAAVLPVPVTEPADVRGAEAVPAPHPIQRSKRAPSRPKPPAATTRPALPRNPAIPPEAYAWVAKGLAHRG
ncbi:MAG: helix-turn-helix domain-containing protein [Pseudonocardiaceae bacterium]